MIIAHAGFSPNPITAPVNNLTQALSTIVGQQFDIYGDAVDSNDPSASFSFQWQVLNLRTNQTASISNVNQANTTLQNFSGVWGNIRCFLIATNTATQETSESNPILAPDSAFITLELSSSNKKLTLPAIGSRNWYNSQDKVSQEVEDFTQGESIQSASVNGAGELIIELVSGETINAGVVQGADGADGADGTDGTNGTDGDSAYDIWLAQGNTGTEADFLASLQGEDGADGVDGTDGTNGTNGTNGDSAYDIWLSQGNTGTEADFLASLQGEDGADGASITNELAFTTDVHYWYDWDNQTYHQGFNPPKLIVVAGCFVNTTADMAIQQLNVNIKDGGSLNNTASFYLFTATASGWINKSINTTSMIASMPAQTVPNAPSNAQVGDTGLIVTTGTYFGVAMTTPTQGAIHGLSITILGKEV